MSLDDIEQFEPATPASARRSQHQSPLNSLNKTQASPGSPDRVVALRPVAGGGQWGAPTGTAESKVSSEAYSVSSEQPTDSARGDPLTPKTPRSARVKSARSVRSSKNNYAGVTTDEEDYGDDFEAFDSAVEED